MSRSILLDAEGQPVYNRGFDLDELIDNLPAGLERAIRRVLEYHKGRKNAISRFQLISDLASVGFDYIDKDDRPIRVCINKIRKSGTPKSWICSTGGLGGGYWLAKNQEEMEEFIENEEESRLGDFAKQVRAMRSAAEKHWGRYSPEKQASLF
jgi:hypothetical protein